MNDANKKWKRKIILLLCEDISSGWEFDKI